MPKQTTKTILDRFLGINPNYISSGICSPHKPLLLIWAISKCIQDEIEQKSFHNRLQPFDFYKAEFEPNIQKYGLSRTLIKIDLPYWHLKNDEVWDLNLPFEYESNIRPVSTILKGTEAGLIEQDYISIRNNPDLGIEIILQLLLRFIPNSFHEGILLDANVPLVKFKKDEDKPMGLFEIYKRRVRNYLFRQKVLPAYHFKCAVCYHSIQLYDKYLALEAAHIKAIKYDGPDMINNGLSLCSNHHALFDSGAFTIAPHSNGLFFVEVSDKINQKYNEKWLMPYSKHQLVAPKDIAHRPELEFIEWHRDNVFAK